MSICRKHGKERNVIVFTSKKGRNGRALEYVGCQDCAAAELVKKDQSLGKQEPIKAKSEGRQEPEKKQVPADPPKVKTLGQRFGFKL
jgi:hypothetical protein